jgi:hypothetical protein
VVEEIKEGSDPRLPLELALVRVSRPQNELGLVALEQRLARLEAGTPAAAAPAPAPPAPAPPAAPSSEQAPPAPADVPPAADPAPELTIDQVVERWTDAILPEIGRRSMPLHALVVSARPVSYEGGELVLGLPEAFAQGMVETPQNLQLVAEVAGQAIGATPRIRYVVSGEGSGDPADEPAEHVSEDELVSRIAETFDAHEV